MAGRESPRFSFAEVCEATEQSSSVAIEVVEHAIVEPVGTEPGSWAFDTQMVVLTKKPVVCTATWAR